MVLVEDCPFLRFVPVLDFTLFIQNVRLGILYVKVQYCVEYCSEWVLTSLPLVQVLNHG